MGSLLFFRGATGVGCGEADGTGAGRTPLRCCGGLLTDDGVVAAGAGRGAEDSVFAGRGRMLSGGAAGGGGFNAARLVLASTAETGRLAGSNSRRPQTNCTS